MLITVFGPPTIMPSPLQLRFAVRFTTPLTTCPHAAFDDDDDELLVLLLECHLVVQPQVLLYQLSMCSM